MEGLVLEVGGRARLLGQRLGLLGHHFATNQLIQCCLGLLHGGFHLLLIRPLQLHRGDYEI